MVFLFTRPRAAFADADQEKRYAAGTSVLAAFFLLTFKGIVGFMTGSLGILAEALHSTLDLVAALITFFAVRISGRPADHDHLYGHGKYENLSALLETLLLLLTCFWIFYEAVRRIVTGQVHVEVTIWAFLVMIISIVVDVSRSRMLFAVAKKHNSQALEADALHFSTDIWSSAVVILGLICVSVSGWFRNADFLRYADAIAAIVVGLIVVQVSFKLGIRTIHALLDTAPADLDKEVIQIVEKIPGVKNCHQVRVRSSGARIFVDLHVLIDGNRTLNEVHRLTEEIEWCIREAVPDSDVTVHPEPC